MRMIRSVFLRLLFYIPIAALVFAVSASSGLAGCGDSCVHVRITDDSIPDGRKGVVYMFNLQADSGCDSSYDSESFTWSMVSGDLPPGISLNSEGHIRGTPTLAGEFTLTVEAIHPSRDSSAQKGFSIAIVDN